MNVSNDQSFPGKIAVITSTASLNEDDFHSVDRLVVKYGRDKIVHVVWPEEDSIVKPENMIEIHVKLARDKEIKAMIVNQDIPGTNAAIDKFKAIRDDVFIIYCVVHEPAADAVKFANLLLRSNEPGMGKAMVKQAKKQGAKVFVYYSFPRHMMVTPLADCRDMIRKTGEAEGIMFVDVTIPDPAEVGIVNAQRFILGDVPQMVSKYGEDTAFFCSNCHLQTPLIKAVVDNHAIYPQPCCPSPFHGFPEALGIQTGGNHSDLNYVIAEACRIAEEKNMSDRLSTWPVSASMLFTNAGAEYAIKWINHEVSRNRIDDKVLEECMSEYVKEIVGEGVEIEMTSYVENGITYDNFKLLLMSYLDF